MTESERACPVCEGGIGLGRETGLREFEPCPGDVCICLNCGAAFRVVKDLDLELLDPREVDRMGPDAVAGVALARRQAVEFRAARDRLN